MKNRLFRVFISHSFPLLFTIIILGSGAVFITNRFAARSSEEEARNQLEQIQAYYEVILGEMDSLSVMFSTSAEIIGRLRYLLEADKWEWIDANYARLIRSYISATANARPDVESIYVYLENNKDRVLSSGNGIVSMSTLTDTAWYYSFLSDQEVHEFRAERTVKPSEVSPANNTRILRIYRTIYDAKPQAIGVIVLNLLEDRLINDYPSFSRNGNFLFMINGRNGGRLISVPRDLNVAEETLRKKYARFSIFSPRFQWEYELYIPTAFLYRIPRTIGLMTIALSLLVCIPGLLLTYKTNQKETRFLKNVLDQFKAAGVRRLQWRPLRDTENIFDYLNTQILGTFLQQDYLLIQKEAMEYRSLQMQINPHFLYNTLETINWKAIALLNGPNDISRMIHLLSGILKYSVQIPKQSGVSLKEEIEHTKSYLELQNYRFEGKFFTYWTVLGDVEGVFVPKLMLQPILENSFIHGLGDDAGMLNIKIEIRREKGRLSILIEDDGNGIDRETLARLNSDTPWTETNSIGLANIKKRIMLFYKGDACMSVGCGLNKGTSVKIVLPLSGA